MTKDDNGKTLQETVDSMNKSGLNVTEQEVKEEFDKLVQEGVLFKDPHGRYYSVEHLVAKAYMGRE